MSDGWLLAGGIIVLFIGAFIAETYRVPRIEKWGRRHGFVRNDGEGDALRTNRLVEIYGDGHRPARWGMVMTGRIGDAVVTIAECDLWTGYRQKYWFNLVSMERPGPELLAFRLQSRNRIAEKVGGIISLPLWPLIWLVERAERSRLEKWLDQWTEKPIELPVLDFSADQAFARSFIVSGEISAARNALCPALRAALLECRWKGDLFARGGIVVWRRRGLLWPWRMERLAAEVRLFQDILRGA